MGDGVCGGGECCAGGLEGGPTIIGEVWGEGDVADEAAPLDEGALDIAGAEGLGEHFVF